ncbi:glutamine synthetase family protein [Kitasatospora phosalacinea]|uniref:Glutamine synthetase n=1 Tax=Kitasatospora phosalacinea TaxID=2065 RepID=A0A9W6PNF2_9ACTN|nr:glutamine synthetase family protein [Kitasatospora phosalacinea]GLW58058.1 glutamine synthetase [Kitasatospora phosalacinea]
MSTPEGSLVDLIDGGGVDSVVVAVADVQGRMKGKLFDAGTLRTRLEREPVSSEVCGYLLGTDLGMTPAERGTWSWESGFGDIELDWHVERARRLPWLPDTALVWATPMQNGQPHPLSPAGILARQVAGLVGMDLTPMVGLECEFVLVEGSERDAERSGWRPRPATLGNLDYALDLPGNVAAFLRELRRMLAEAGLPIEALKLEGAPGQVEVTFPFGPVERACEQHLLLKMAAKAVADQHGMSALFMAAPFTGTGSGLHLHLSLHQLDGGASVFTLGSGEELLSETGRQAVAGLLDVLPVTGPLWAPTVNSYRRLARDHGFAPRRATWGWDNRSCAVRVVGHGGSRRLEVRVPGADANPYLAVAAALAGIRHGIAGGLVPPEPARGDSYQDAKAWPLPRDLASAVREFETDPAVAEQFGVQVIAHLAALARLELDHHAPLVSAAEVARGFAQS